MVNLIHLGILLTIFLIPLLTPFQDFGFEGGKVIFFIFLNSLIGFLWLIWFFKNKIKYKWSFINTASLIFIGFLALTSVLGKDPFASLVGRYPYFQGVIFYCYLWLFSLIVSSIDLSKKQLGMAVNLSAALVSLSALIQYVEMNFLGQIIPTYGGKVISTFGQPNFYSGFLLLSLPFLNWIKDLKLKLSLFILVVLAVVVSGSRVAITLMVLFLGWVLVKKLTNRVKFVLLFITIVITILSQLASLYFKTGILYQEIWQPQDTYWLKYNSPEKRFYIWKISADLISKEYLSGVGLENIGLSFADFISNIDFNSNKEPHLYTFKDLTVDRTHNYSLDLLFFSGIVGLSCWILLVLSLIIPAKKKELLIPLLIYLVWVQFQNQSMVQLLYFWLLIGLTDSN